MCYTVCDLAITQKLSEPAKTTEISRTTLQKHFARSHTTMRSKHVANMEDNNTKSFCVMRRQWAKEKFPTSIPVSGNVNCSVCQFLVSPMRVVGCKGGSRYFEGDSKRYHNVSRSQRFKKVISHKN